MGRKDARVNTVVFLHLVFFSFTTQLLFCMQFLGINHCFYKRIFLRHLTEKMMENGTACSENDSAVLKLIFKKKNMNDIHD